MTLWTIFVCCDLIVSAIVGRPIDGNVIDVVLVRGAILTCFFGSKLAYDLFFMAFDLREIGETLAVFRSTFLPSEMVAVVLVMEADDVGNVSNFMVVPFAVAAAVVTVAAAAVVAVAAIPILSLLNDRVVSSFCCVALVVVVKCGTVVVVGRTTILVKSFRRLGSAFI